MCLKVCAWVQKMAFKAPKIYQSHSPRRPYLRSLSHFCFQEGKRFFVLQEERITEVFILPTSIFIIHVLFHFWKGHKSGANWINYDPARTDPLKARAVQGLQGMFSGGCGAGEGQVLHLSLQTCSQRLLVSGQASTHLGFRPSSHRDLTCTEKSYHTSLETY